MSGSNDSGFSFQDNRKIDPQTHQVRESEAPAPEGADDTVNPFASVGEGVVAGGRYLRAQSAGQYGRAGAAGLCCTFGGCGIDRSGPAGRKKILHRVCANIGRDARAAEGEQKMLGRGDEARLGERCDPADLGGAIEGGDVVARGASNAGERPSRVDDPSPDREMHSSTPLSR